MLAASSYRLLCAATAQTAVDETVYRKNFSW